jgi:hypothetical protein
MIDWVTTCSKMHTEVCRQRVKKEVEKALEQVLKKLRPECEPIVEVNC